MWKSTSQIKDMLGFSSGLGLVIVSLFLGIALVVGLFPGIVGYDPFQISATGILLPPSYTYLFGTDNLGRSIVKEVLIAIPLDAFVSLGVVVVSVAVGGVLGALAGYVGGRADEIIMRVTDMFLSFPALILAVGISATLGPGATNAMISIIVVDWPTYARFARGDALAIRDQAFVKAARFNGRNITYILRKHIFPNIAPSLISYASVDMGFAIITLSILGYLGLGAQPPAVELGMLVFQGQSYLSNAPWFSLIPGAIILIVTIGFSFVGDALRDVLDPTRRK